MWFDCPLISASLPHNAVLIPSGSTELGSCQGIDDLQHLAEQAVLSLVLHIWIGPR
ncbi:hypothetical protein C8Q80DRAFT_1187675 [Daedaleopsis nitida]|nr:hypothetical protein C8Q80DRAFT_1187675 [Daedaleopsis nitida]